MKKFGRRKGMLISLSIISSILCLLYILGTQFDFVNATEEFKVANTRENAPKHIDIVNGDFENPTIDGRWAYIKAMNTYLGDEIYLGAWNISRDSEYLELKKIGYGSVETSQSLELVSDAPLYVYQNFEASAKKKIYINFNYMSPRGSEDALKVYLAGEDSDRDEDKLIFKATASVAWKNETITYEIPNGQIQNSIGFFSEGSGSSFEGVNIDDVDIKAEAHPVLEKSSDKSIADLKDVSEIRYNISIKNYGQVPAIISNISDMLDRNISSISDLKLDNVNIDNYVIDNSTLDINFADTFLLEPEESAELSYIAHLNISSMNENLYTLRTQTKLDYKDFAYNLQGVETEAYSNIYEQQVYKSETGSNTDNRNELRDFGEVNVNKSSGGIIALNKKEDGKNELEFKLELENPKNLNIGGSILRYNINIENKSDKSIKHIWLRAYVPKYTNYFGNDNLGEYGYVNNREHITWYIGEIEPKTAKKLYYDVVVDYCLGGAIGTDTYYEILDEDEKPYYNIKTNPKNRLD